MSEVKLLPLPEKSEIDRHLPTGVRVYGYTNDDMRAYARANMEPLITENERLRAEVARLRRSLNEAIIHGNRQSGRAERLAEALRHTKEKLEQVAAIRGGHGTFAGTYLIVTEALDQEGGNG